MRKILFFVALVSSCATYASNTDGNNSACGDAILQTCGPFNDSKGRKDCVAEVMKTGPCQSNNTNDQCTNPTDLTQAKKDYTASCEGLTGNCADIARTCLCKGKSDSDGPKYCANASQDDTNSEATDDSGKRTKVDKRTQGRLDALAACPNLAGAQYDKLKSAEEKSKTKLDDLKQKLLEKKQKAGELQAKITAAQKDLESGTQEINSKLQESLNDMKAKMAENQKKASAEINQMNDAITKQLEDEAQAYNDKLSELHKLDGMCYQVGLQALQAFLADRNSKLSSSTLSAGDFNQLVSTVGPSRSTKNADVAYAAYHNCMTTPPHTTATDETIAAFNKKVTDIRDRIAAIKRDQNKLINDNFGAQAQQVQQTQISDMQKKAQVEIQKLQTSTQSTISSIYPELNALLGKSAGNPCSQNAAANANCLNQFFSNNSKTSARADAAGTDGEIGQLQMEVTAAEKEEAANLTLFKKVEDLSKGVTNDKAANLSTTYKNWMDAEATYVSNCCPVASNVAAPKGNQCYSIVSDLIKNFRSDDLSDGVQKAYAPTSSTPNAQNSAGAVNADKKP